MLKLGLTSGTTDTLPISDRRVAILIYVTSTEAYYTPDAGIVCQSGERVEGSKSKMMVQKMGAKTQNLCLINISLIQSHTNF